jgi:hypothetical protein
MAACAGRASSTRCWNRADLGDDLRDPARRRRAQRIPRLFPLPIWTADLFQNSGLPPHLIIFGMIVLYLFLGCIMDSLAMILITIPIFWPIVAGLDFGMSQDDVKLWFGIITLMVVEMGDHRRSAERVRHQFMARTCR